MGKVESGSDPKAFTKAAQLLKEGRLVAIPTETVYGLAAIYNNRSAVEEIFEVKGRPKNDPLIVHISNPKQLDELVSDIPIEAKQLMQSFWPGPLTVVLPKKKGVSDAITADLPSVAVRMPKHPIAFRLIEAVGAPLVAPSANRFQSISPTNAQAVVTELGNKVPLILDGGECEKGIESTVVGFEGGVNVLRLGAIPVEDIELALGQKVNVRDTIGTSDSFQQSSPGQMSFHYAPKSPLKLFDSPPEKTDAYTWLVYSNYEKKLVIERGAKEVFVLSPNADLAEASQRFFAYLRRADLLRKPIAALKLPESGVGRAINDRLSRASHT